MISLIAQERLLGFVLGAAVVGVTVMDQRVAISRSISSRNQSPTRPECQPRRSIIGSSERILFLEDLPSFLSFFSFCCSCYRMQLVLLLPSDRPPVGAATGETFSRGGCHRVDLVLSAVPPSITATAVGNPCCWSRRKGVLLLLSLEDPSVAVGQIPKGCCCSRDPPVHLSGYGLKEELSL